MHPRERSAIAREGRLRPTALLASIGWLLALAGPVPADPGATSGTQRALVERLTGWTGDGQRRPFARSTTQEKRRALAVLEEHLRALDLAPVRHPYRFRNVNGLVDLLLPPYRGVNLSARIPATGTAEETVIFGAHYDSERGSPGAIDNASGVAVVLAVADALSRLPDRRRDALVVFFDQEEDDEVGSRAFARWLLRTGLPVHSAHVVDLAGWNPSGDGSIDLQSPPDELLRVYEPLARELGIPIEVTRGGSSDNRSFQEADLPVVGIFDSEITPHLHRPTDTVEVLDWEQLDRATLLVVAAARELVGP